MNTYTLLATVLLLGALSFAVYRMISSTHSTELPTQGTPVDLSSMTKSELLDYAKVNNIKINSRSKKADIVEALQSPQS